jgi:hypothetical protein
MGSAGALRLVIGEGSPEAVSVAVEGNREVVKGTLVLPEVRRVVRRGRMRGYRRASRSALLRALGARSFVVGRLVLYSVLDHCRHLMAVLEALGFVAGAARRVGP